MRNRREAISSLDIVRQSTERRRRSATDDDLDLHLELLRQRLARVQARGGMFGLIEAGPLLRGSRSGRPGVPALPKRETNRVGPPVRQGW